MVQLTPTRQAFTLSLWTEWRRRLTDWEEASTTNLTLMPSSNMGLTSNRSFAAAGRG
jgi:hypothetical protein